MTKKFKTINCCRVCKSENITKIISLGMQPLANSLKDSKIKKDQLYPLTIFFCKKCSLIQLAETINKSILFKDYLWVTGTSKNTHSYLKKISKIISQMSFLKKNDRIIEIASNDGTLLKIFKSMGYKNILGVDPAINLAKKANKEGVKTIADFWSLPLSKKITKKKGKSNLIIARNVIPHVSNLISVIKGIKYNLNKSGVGIIEFHDASYILSQLHYDSIYHEHLNYFSTASMENLLVSEKLYPFHVENSPISGGSIVIFFDHGVRKKTRNYIRKLNNDIESKVNKVSAWRKFALSVKEHKKTIKFFFNNNKNKKILGFGSSARSQTFLNYCKINNNDINLIFDNNILKQNLYSPGSNILITNINSNSLKENDFIFILAWNFKKEIILQCKQLGFKGKFVTCFPNNIKIER